MDIKEIVKSYQDKDDNNPIYAAFNLITFAKAIPWHIGKAILLALLLYFLLTFAMVKLGFSYLFLFLGFVFGLIWALIVGFSAGIKFITGGLIDNFTDLLTGVVEPVDDMYDRWKAQSNSDMSRAAFFKDVAREVIVPEFTSLLKFLPFKGRIEKYLQVFLDHVFDREEAKEKADLGVAATTEKKTSGLDSSKSFVASIVDSIEDGTGHIQSKISSPFWKTLKWGIIFCGGMLLLHWLLGR